MQNIPRRTKVALGDHIWHLCSRKGKKRSKGVAPDEAASTAKENADKENIAVKEMVDRENMDKENIAAENLFSDPSEECEEGGRGEEQTAVGGPSHILPPPISTIPLHPTFPWPHL